MNPRALLLLPMLALAACAPVPERVGMPEAQWRASPNFNERRANFVILHHTGDNSADASLGTLTSAFREVSAHYLVGRDGGIYQLVDERQRAWHAGESYWGGNTDLNSVSIGIELDNNGREPFADAQIVSLLRLLEDITQRHRIPPANILGHADVAPRRKVDPSGLFPWRTLAARGYGLWCEPPYPEPPAAFDAMLGLQALGYELANPSSTVAAFRRRYLPDATDSRLTERDRALVHCLLQKRAEYVP
jgi:N-acetylmuramoyl-L-alanine amidase